MANASVTQSGLQLSYQCLPGHRFPDGSKIANLSCTDAIEIAGSDPFLCLGEIYDLIYFFRFVVCFDKSLNSDQHLMWLPIMSFIFVFRFFCS